MVELTKTNSYRMIVYKNLPVREQRRIQNNINVVFYNGDEKLVTESEWRTHSRQVFIPKELGGRTHVANNWSKYNKFINQKTE